MKGLINRVVMTCKDSEHLMSGTVIIRILLTTRNDMAAGGGELRRICVLFVRDDRSALSLLAEAMDLAKAREERN